ncbi:MULTISPECIES: sigma-54-dependent Fis family transcriptional regulator [unclassified Enterococcus]|uniref:sigma-54-dependent Fis family transcriptional regulator n=1 Tax=unclassified Enterococcus TaxID=2608891 RepID=UPI0032DF29CE
MASEENSVITHNSRIPFRLSPKVASSWEFCFKHQVNPLATRPEKILDYKELQVKQRANKELIRCVKNELDRLEQKLKVRRPLFVLTDNEGNILWRTGNYQAKDYANEIAFQEGSNWSELQVGTNAIGMALRTKEASFLSLDEHFSKASQHWSCAASPILDENDQILGVLDISTYQNQSAKDALILLTVLTERVANQMMKYHFAQRNTLLEIAMNDFEEVYYCDSHYRLIKLPRNAALDFHLGTDIRDSIDDKTIYNQTSILSNQELIGYKYKIYSGTQPPVRQTKSYYYPGVASQSKKYQAFLSDVLKVSNSDLPIHIFGESGSGKEIIAKTIHYNSAMSKGELIAINCGAVSESLLESELFGYAAGAFTGANAKGFKGKLEQANGGTLFLDEIDSMPEKMQQVLLRVLEDKLVTPISGKPVVTNFRLVTASNKDLKALVKAGKFREDLFYRIYVCSLDIPPLRAHIEDLRPLVEQYAIQHGWLIDWQEKLIKVAETYPWYGNIREFNNFLARASIFYRNAEPSVVELSQLIQSGIVYQAIDQEAPASSETVDQKVKIQRALEKNFFNMTKTAKYLEISRATLYRWLKKYEIVIES